MKPIALLLSISILAWAQAWKLEHFKKDSVVQESFSAGDCEVTPLVNNRGVDLWAKGLYGIRGPNSRVEQSVHISLASNGKVEVKQDWLVENDGGFIIPEAIFPRHKPDIFAMNCQTRAALLPKRVKKLFWGEYGMGKAPRTTKN